MTCELKDKLEQIQKSVQHKQKQAVDSKKQLDYHLSEYEKFKEQTGKSFNDYINAIFTYNPTKYVVTKFENIKRSYVAYFKNISDQLPELGGKVGKGFLGSVGVDTKLHIATAKDILQGNSSELINKVKKVVQALDTSFKKTINEPFDLKEVVEFNLETLGKIANKTQKEAMRKVRAGEMKSYELVEYFGDEIFEHMHDIGSTVEGKIQQASVYEASTKIFGISNIESFLKNFKESVEFTGESVPRIDDVWKYATDQMFADEVTKGVKIIRNLRTVAAFTQLGGAVISALGDVPNSMANALARGQLGSHLKSLFSTTSKLARDELALFAGFIEELGNASSKGMVDEHQAGKRLQELGQATMTYSGLQRVTNHFRQAAHKTILKALFAELQSGNLKLMKNLFKPEDIAQFTARAPEDWDPDTKILFGAGVIQEAESWVIMGSAKTQKNLGGGAPGSFSSEGFKSFTQYLTFVHEMGIRTFEKGQSMTPAETAQYYGAVLAFGIVGAIAVDGIKDTLKGNTPKILNPEDLPAEYWLSMVGSSAPLAPMMLFAPSSYGQSGPGGTASFAAPMTLIKTVKGSIEDIYTGETEKIGPRWMAGARKLMPNTPVKGLTNYIGDGIQEALVPGSTKKKQKRFKKQMKKYKQKELF